MMGINSTQISALKTNLGLPHPLRFQRRLPQGSPWGSHFKELNDTRHFGYQYHSILSSDNQYIVAMVKTYKKSHTVPKAFLFTSGLSCFGYSIIWTFSIHFASYLLERNENHILILT